MQRIAIVGNYGQVHKTALFDLLFTKGDEVGVRKYLSIETLLNDIRRPDLDLVVIMNGVICGNLSSLRATLRTPILHLTTAMSFGIEISNHIAIVQLELKHLDRAKDLRFNFAQAATRWSRPTQTSLETNWPTKLVPREFTKNTRAST